MPRKGGRKGAQRQRGGAPAPPASPRPAQPQDPLPARVREWLEAGRAQLLAEVTRLNKGVVPDTAEAQARLKTLALTCDRKGIRFSGRGLHYLYFSDKLVRRGALLYRLMAALLGDTGGAPGTAGSGGGAGGAPQPCLAQRRAREQLGRPGSRRDEPLRVVSVGGGPGTDISGLVWVNRDFLGGCRRVECALWDYERSWKGYLAALQTCFGPSYQLAFARCDVTASLADSPVNQHVHAQDLRLVDLYVFSYVCCETSKAAEASGHCFYEALARRSPAALFVFLDVQQYSVPVLANVFAALQRGNPDLERYNPPERLPCETMVVCSRAAAAGSADPPAPEAELPEPQLPVDATTMGAPGAVAAVE